jgi:hypothetical protein
VSCIHIAFLVVGFVGVYCTQMAIRIFIQC